MLKTFKTKSARASGGTFAFVAARLRKLDLAFNFHREH